jgi:glycosyl transferase family 87
MVPGLVRAGAGVIAIRARTVLGLGMTVLAAAVGLRFAQFVVRSLSGPGRDFDIAYAVARSGRNVAGDRGNVPTMPLFVRPLASMDAASARKVWALLAVASLASAIGWLIWQLGLDLTWGSGLVALSMASAPTRDNFRYGQAYALLLLLLVLSWHAYRHRLDRSLGVTLGILLAFKLSGLLICLLLAIQRRWRALVWASGVVAIVNLATFELVGPYIWSEYRDMLLSIPTRPVNLLTVYQSEPSFVRRLTEYDARWNPSPLLHFAAGGVVLSWLILVGMLALTIWSAWSIPSIESPGRADTRDLAFGAMVAANLVLSPLTIEYQYTTLLLPIAILLAWARDRSSLWIRTILAIAIIMGTADVAYRSPSVSAGARALLAYPRLYAAAIMWGLALWWCRRTVIGSRYPAASTSRAAIPSRLGHE